MYLKIYLSRALSAWGDRMWTFGVGVFMTKLQNQDLRLVAVYGFSLCLSSIIFGARVGNYIDKTSRLYVAKFFLLVQNLATILCSILLGLYFQFNYVLHNYFYYFTTAIIIFCIISNLASLGSKILIEKDWILVISDNDNEKLASMNSVFRTLDLSCLILAPILVGLIFDFANNQITALFIGFWNLISVFIEFTLLRQIYQQFPNLSVKNDTSSSSPSSENKENSSRSTVQSWTEYFQHPIKNAGLGLSFTYMTVLGFDNITYGFCLSLCVSESALGGLVALSAMVGVTASLIFPLLRRTIGVNYTGLLGFFALITALIPCVISIWITGSPFDLEYFQRKTATDFVCGSYWSVGLLLGGIIGARFGLWLSDLSVTQILQEGVDENNRGSINGVQGSLNSMLDTVKFILVITLPNKETFGWLILASFGSIVIGAISFITYIIKSSSSFDLRGSI